MIRKGLISGRYRPLTEDSIAKIDETVMRVIEEVGFEVNSEAALRLFEEAGAQVDKKERRVRLPEAKVRKLIGIAPPEVRLCGQEEKHDIYLGDSRVYTGTGGTALYIYEPATKQKRSATLQDLKRIARLVNRLDNIHLFMLPTYPNELPIEQVDVNRFFAGLDNTSKHIMGGVYTLDGVKRVIRMAEIAAGSAEKLRQRPIISLVTCSSISPLKMDRRRTH
jgi:trimethylamine--corrinoid protein Co-methyltransferase